MNSFKAFKNNTFNWTIIFLFGYVSLNYTTLIPENCLKCDKKKDQSILIKKFFLQLQR